MKKIFLLDWKNKGNSQLQSIMQNAKFQVKRENPSPKESSKKIKSWLPDFVVVNYDSEPQLSRLVAKHVKDDPDTEKIKIIFVGGKSADLEILTLMELDAIRLNTGSLIDYINNN